MQTLMEALIAAGYPRAEMYHHHSDLYVFATPLTRQVLRDWFQQAGLSAKSFVSAFCDQLTGRVMYDIAFHYAPYWEGETQ